MKNYLFLILLIFTFTTCKTEITKEKKSAQKTQNKIRFIGEQIIPANTLFKDTKVGGLSSIDFANGNYYAISDDKNKPVRFYEMELTYNTDNFSKIEIKNVIKIENNKKGIDPESLRLDKESGHFIWTSEGHTKKGINPAIYEVTKNGKFIKQYSTPKNLKINNQKKHGPRRNGTFEGLSMSSDPNYFWVGMELPLKNDGDKPQLKSGNYPVRISKINKETGEMAFQFAYQLDAIPKDSKPSGKFTINGLPEILEVGKNKFLFLERAYSSGYENGGNTVRIYQVDCKNSTNISNLESLRNQNFVPATKTLLFDFESIRSQLTNGIVDNLEGITFGKTLSNGNQTLVVISDNNFNKFSEQLTQVIVLELDYSVSHLMR